MTLGTSGSSRVRRRAALAWLLAAAAAVAQPALTFAAEPLCQTTVWPRTLAWQQADAVVVARLGDPAVTQVVTPGTGAPGFVRQRWRLQVERVEALRRGQRPPATQALLVDDASWREALRAHQRCRRGDCRPLCVPALETTLSRPPRPGQRVRAFLRRDGAGWELFAERAFDDPSAPRSQP